MIALTFTLHLHEPLLAAQLEGDPNSAVSYPYIPGSVIRGALANRYLANLAAPPADFNLAMDDQGRQLFFDDTTRFLNAYPLDRLGQRTLPVPRSWYHDKLMLLKDRATFIDALTYLSQATPPPDSNDNAARLRVADTIVMLPDDIEWKQVNDDGDHLFCRVERREGNPDEGELVTTDVEFVPVERYVAVHTQREQRKGRPTQAEGAVFRYESIAAGQRFGGVILVDVKDETRTADERATLEEARVQELTTLLTGDFWLGKSRSAGYGHVSILDVKTNKVWQETAAPSDVSSGEYVVVTLLSDLVSHTPDGAPADELTPDSLPAPLRGADESVVSFKRVRLSGGFNRRWGLPTPQAHVLAAGSVFVFRATRDIAASELQAIVQSGVGERRGDGCGRVALNGPGRDLQLRVREVKAGASSTAVPTIPPAHQPLAERMVERLLRRDLDRRLAEYIHQPALEIPPSLTNAQLSRLRAIALDAVAAGDTQRLVSFLADTGLRARARGQYEAARIGELPARVWLLTHLERPTELWARLGFKAKTDSPGDYEDLCQIGQVRAQLTPTLANEYTLRLVEGILHRIVQERKAAEKERQRREEADHAAR